MTHKKNDNTIVISKIDGDDSTIFISRDETLYNFSIVKNKYASNEKLQKWDSLVFDSQKLEDLANWIAGLSSKTEKRYVLECNCKSEILVVYYDPDDDCIYAETFDNYWLKQKYHKKLSHSFSAKRAKFCDFLENFLNKA